jgi:hypothetical protein
MWFLVFLYKWYLVWHTHYRNRVLCRMSNTLGKGYFTLGKGFTECNTRQRTLDKYFIGKGFFAEYFFSDTRQRLCRVSESTRQRKTLGKLRIDFLKKNSKTFFLNYRNYSPNPTYYLTHCPIIFHYYFESNLYVLCEWWDSNSQPPSRAYPPIPLHYYTNYVYITFSFSCIIINRE